MRQNYSIIMDSDSYKGSHYLQYPHGTEYISSYIEARSDKNYPFALFFGLQMILTKLKAPTIEDVMEANEILTSHGFEFNLQDWKDISNLGYLPIRIQAVKEGLVIPNHNILVQIVNTDPRFPWLTSYVETMLLRIWYPITVATRSKFIKNILLDSLNETGDPNLINFKLHDFGFRGVSSEESGSIGGIAHLVNFMGTDTLGAISYGRKYYGETMAGFSIPAAEHSTITSWGRDGEAKAYENMLDKFAKPGRVVAVVSDSYDLMAAVKDLWGNRFKDKIKESGATLVVRPDCYDEETQLLTGNGWKFFKDLTGNEKVAQVNNDLSIDYVTPIKYVNQPYEGEMVKFSDEKGRLDLLVTPNHRMVTIKNKLKLEIEEASNIKFYYNKDIPRSFSINNGSESLSWFERFLVAFQADGSFPSGHDKIKNNVCGYVKTRFNFQKKRKIERLKYICENGGFEYDIMQEPNRGKALDQVTFYVNIPISLNLDKYFNWVGPQNRSSQWCKEFIDEVSNWDSNIRDNGRIKYDTTIPYNAEVVQLAAAIAGYGATYGVYEDNRKEIFNDIHSISITNKNVIGGQSISKEVVQYSGNIYCVQVPTGMLVVRRNNKISICGNSGDPTLVPLEVIEQLARDFGYTTNEKGYKVLPSCVRVIQGDGVNERSIKECLYNINIEGFSTDNITFGMGGELLQTVNRDTLGFAMKASAIKDNKGFWGDVYKAPKTDPSKVSKKGRLALIKENGEYQTIRETDLGSRQNLLEDVFVDGKILRYQTLSEIRSLSNL